MYKNEVVLSTGGLLSGVLIALHQLAPTSWRAGVPSCAPPSSIAWQNAQHSK